MQRLRFMHAADLHLDSPLRGLETYRDAPVAQLRQASRRALENLVARALAEQIDLLLLAGDLFDGDWPDYNTALFFAHCLGRLTAAGINVVCVSGNHDAQSSLARHLQWPDGVYLLDAQQPQSLPLESLQTVVHGQSYSQSREERNLAQHFPPAVAGYWNIGLLHTSLDGRPGHEPYAPCCLADLTAKKYDYWALGHVHQHEVVHMSPPVVFAGNLQGRHMRETGAKGAVLVQLQSQQSPHLEFVTLDGVRWQQASVDVTGCEGLETVLQRLNSVCQEQKQQHPDHQLALRLHLQGPCAAHHQLLHDPQAFRQQAREVAAAIPGLWLEQVKLQGVAAPVPLEVDADHPLHGVLQCIEALDGDAAQLLELVPELKALQGQLPTAVQADYGPLGAGIATEPESLRQELRSLVYSVLWGGSRTYED